MAYPVHKPASKKYPLATHKKPRISLSVYHQKTLEIQTALSPLHALTFPQKESAGALSHALRVGGVFVFVFFTRLPLVCVGFLPPFRF